jgi:hypothetical protein
MEVRTMNEEARTELITVTLTPREKAMLAELADKMGATKSGLVRRLVREAASRHIVEKGVRDDTCAESAK